MLVYGDRASIASTQALIGEIEAAVIEAAGATGLARTDLLTHALIRAGELAQGVADAELEFGGLDDLTPAQEASLAVAVAVARALAAGGDAGEARGALGRLRAAPLPEALRCKTAEGFAFYAIYPEAYAAAAAAYAWSGRPLVIGLRSIGTSLGAAVAASTDGQLVTVRPCGHPFRREIRPSAALEARLAAHRGSFAVVDEGPGLSGSSFGAVGDLLEALRVSSDRIVYMTSHAGELGQQASSRHRARWSTATRLVATGIVSAATVARWFADVIGPASCVSDLSGGAWRNELPEADRPPAAPATERLKVRLGAPGGRYLARFAGLGAVGEAKLNAGRTLHAAGFAPEPLALRRGFLLERWVEGRPLTAQDLRQPRMLAQVARYLGLRARLLPATAAEGADAESLREMARINATELGGEPLGGRVEARLIGLERLTGLRPVRIDGRLHAWEWRRRPDGTLCKTDGLDHAAAHDLVGCQDVAWDVAGAAVELGLAPREAEALRRSVQAEARRAVDPRAVAAFRLCYAAFQAGAWSMAAKASPQEKPRVEAELDRYLADLRAEPEAAPGG